MVCCESGPLVIRTMEEPDARTIAAGERDQGCGTAPDRFLTRLREQAEGKCTAILAVGLHKYYGPAQRLYIKRGCLPDGSGIWYGEKPCEPYEKYRNDGELNLYLVKDLRRRDA